MLTKKTETLPIRQTQDIVVVRQKVRSYAIASKFGIVDQTKVVTAASELARNTLDYGRGGECRLELVEDGIRTGVKMTFVDQGPGIIDIEKALTDGYTTGSGMGLGLSGSKRLMSEFSIATKPGEGTQVTAIKWK